MAELDIRQLPSRRLKTVTPIPWAEPAPLTAQEYPSYLPPDKFDQGGLGRKIQVLGELNEYPQTPIPVEYPSIVKSGFNFNSGLSRKGLVDPELDQYPETVIPFGFSAVVKTGFNFNDGLIRKRLDPLELNERPATPPGFLSGFYPGSKAVEALTKSSSYSLQTVPELNVYPQALISVPITSTDLIGYNFNPGLSRKRLDVELSEYPATPPGFLSGFYPGSAAVQAFRHKFERTLQTVTLSRFEPKAVAPFSPGALLPPVTLFNSGGGYKLVEAPFSFAYIAPPTATPLAPSRGLTVTGVFGDGFTAKGSF